jgi:hypothetical protein
MDGLLIGPFAVAPDGAIGPASPDTRPVLRFAWRGHACEAAVGPRRLTLRAWAGRIPSTAEPDACRASAFGAISDVAQLLPTGWAARLAADHRVRLETDQTLSGPVSAVTLIAEMVRFALALDPYLERLDAAGVAESAGTEKIWPG